MANQEPLGCAWRIVKFGCGDGQFTHFRMYSLNGGDNTHLICLALLDLIASPISSDSDIEVLIRLPNKSLRPHFPSPELQLAVRAEAKDEWERYVAVMIRADLD